MSIDPMLENYLARLERILQPLAVSERAEIVTEIKSHILDALERGDPKPTLASVLESMGTPEHVANRYLMEKQIPMSKPPVSPLVKWLFAGCFLTFASMFLLAAVIVWKFVNPEMLKTLRDLDLNFNDGNVVVNGKTFKKTKTYELLPEESSLAVKFTDGKVTIENSESREFTAKCKMNQQELPSELVKNAEGIRMLNLGNVDCDLAIPRGVALTVQGSKGLLEVEEPLFSLDATLDMGLVKIEPHEGTRYGYELHTDFGAVANKLQSDANPEFQMKVHVKMGSIENE